MDRIGWQLGFCWATAEGEQGSKKVDSTSKQVSDGMNLGLVRIGKTVKS